jgi:metallo-beta-lactamase family protein
VDHSGFLPVLVREGFSGPVFCTEPTRDLCGLLLPDSGRLHELDAEYANRKGFSRHRPALPLYTEADAVRCLDRLRPVGFHEPISLGPGLDLSFFPAGHILGAASVHVRSEHLDVVFSGDLGRGDDAIMPPPEPPPAADYIVVESTYGDRLHEAADAVEAIGEAVRRTAGRGGTVVVPAFAVGRTQALLLALHRLRSAGAIPDLPIYLDSPLATGATRIYERWSRLHRLVGDECRQVCELPRFVRDARESKALNDDDRPKIIISASGMATGGRVIHHLERWLPDPRATVLLSGFQAGGTRGAALAGGATEIKIHGRYVPVRAEVVQLHMLSAHADAAELVAWLAKAPRPPHRVFVNHGEPSASDALRRRIEESLGWSCVVPAQRDEFVLRPGDNGRS